MSSIQSNLLPVSENGENNMIAQLVPFPLWSHAVEELFLLVSSHLHPVPSGYFTFSESISELILPPLDRPPSLSPVL